MTEEAPVTRAAPLVPSSGGAAADVTRGEPTVMAQFRVTFVSRKTEQVRATRYVDIGRSWVVFQRDDEQGDAIEVLRLKASMIMRIERVDA
jgi:hypothetical protein